MRIAKARSCVVQFTEGRENGAGHRIADCHPVTVKDGASTTGLRGEGGEGSTLSDGFKSLGVQRTKIVKPFAALPG